MIAKIYIPQEKNIGIKKTNIRGFWKNESGKIYYDYIDIQQFDFNDKCQLFKLLNAIKKDYQQEAIFFTLESGFNCKAYVYVNNNTIEKLSSWHRIVVFKNTLKNTIKSYLKKYNGVTVYKKSHGITKQNLYTIESWTK